MHLSNQAINYLESLPLNTIINSNIIITDLEKIIYTSNFNNNNYFLSKSISNDLLNIIECWNDTTISENLFYIKNNPNINIIKEDNNTYDSLIIFPLYLENKLSGLSIFFRNGGYYIKTSLKSLNTIRKWIMKIMGNEIFPIHKNIF